MSAGHGAPNNATVIGRHDRLTAMGSSGEESGLDLVAHAGTLAPPSKPMAMPTGLDHTFHGGISCVLSLTW